MLSLFQIYVEGIRIPFLVLAFKEKEAIEKLKKMTRSDIEDDILKINEIIGFIMQ